MDDPIVRRIEALIPRDYDTLDHPAVATRDGAASETGCRPAVPAGYELVGEIGAGGMGVVCKVKNLALGGRLEALKTIRAGEFAGPKAVARFRFEAEYAAGLDHPNVVTVYAVGEGPSGPYLTMRFVDGHSLSDRPPTTPRTIAALMAKVARAVHFAHQRGILHRDLKPQNILVDAAGEPFVADFGIARRLDADPTLTLAGAPIGTAAYMAPEQARGAANLTVAADGYSLGVILYWLLTGTLPYTGTTSDILRLVQSAEAPPEPRRVNPAADPDLEAICLKCLEKDPADRYRTAGELAADLERFAHGEAVTARPPGFWDWVRQLGKTRPEQHPHYSWQVTTWFGVLMLAASVATFAAVRAGASAAWVWGANAGCAVAQSVVLWWYMIRRFRQLPVTERHSLIIAAGCIWVYAVLTAAHVPLSATAPAARALDLYPPLMASCGLGLFTLGSTNWSRFFPIGVAVIGLYPVMTRWPDYAPLVFGGTVSAVMWFWSYAKKVTFGRLWTSPPG